MSAPNNRFELDGLPGAQLQLYFVVLKKLLLRHPLTAYNLLQ